MSVSNDLKKKELIKKAARDLFFRFGFNKTSMEDIAKQSGLAKPTLYYYYESKNSIFNEIVIEEATRFMDKVETKIPDTLPDWQAHHRTAAMDGDRLKLVTVILISAVEASPCGSDTVNEMG